MMNSEASNNLSVHKKSNSSVSFMTFITGITRMASMTVFKQINCMVLTASLLCAQAVYADAGLPDFGLHTLDGKAYSINDDIGQGQWVLLMFWATDCSVCRQQEPMISSFHENHSGKDARVIGISIDGLDKKKTSCAIWPTMN